MTSSWLARKVAEHSARRRLLSAASREDQRGFVINPYAFGGAPPPPPPPPPTDAHYRNVSLLLSGDGVNASTSIADNSRRARSQAGASGATISSAQSKWGTTSLRIDGTANSHVRFAQHADFDFGTHPLTIEFWFYSNGTHGPYSRLLATRDGDTNQGLALIIADPTGTNLQIGYSVSFNGTSQTYYAKVHTISASTWTHIAICRLADGSFKLFVGGVNVHSGSPGTGALYWNASDVLVIGGNATGTSRSVNGYYNDVRITKGEARYTVGFTPPSAALPYVCPADASHAGVVLQLHGNGADESTTILDSSQYPKPWTANGDARIRTAQSKFGGSSLYFDGTGDYLSTPRHDDFDVFAGTADFTFEAWVYIAGNSSLNAANVRDATMLSLFMPTGGSVGTAMQFSVRGDASTTGVGFNVNTFNAGTQRLSYALFTFSQSAWHHVAVTRAAGVLRLFFDGTLTAWTLDQISNTSYLVGNNEPVNVGRRPYASYEDQLNGYIAEMRLTKGVARYTETFTAPTAPFPDRGYERNWAQTMLQLSGEGTHGGTTITDSSRHARSATNTNVVITHEWRARAGASLAFNGSSAYLSYADSDDWNLGSDDWTIELWAMVTTSGANYTLLAHGPNINATAVEWYFGTSTSNQPLFAATDNGAGSWNTLNLSSSSSMTTGRWHHIAVTCQGTTARIFLDGVVTGTATRNTAMPNPPYPVTVGATSTPSLYWPGRIDDIRIIKGLAKYVGNFEPPVCPHEAMPPGDGSTNWTATKLLIGADAANNSTSIIDLSASARTITVTGDAKVSTTQARFGGSAMYFDGTGDYVSLAHHADFDFAAGDFTIELWLWSASYQSGKGVLHKGWVSGAGYTPFLFYMGGSNDVVFYASSSGSSWDVANNVAITGTNYPLSCWIHLAVTRSGNNFRAFMNGRVVSSFTSSATLLANSSQVRAGADDAGNHGMAGYLDEVRLTKGVARYTANFTPPVYQLPRAA